MGLSVLHGQVLEPPHILRVVMPLIVPQSLRMSLQAYSLQPKSVVDTLRSRATAPFPWIHVQQ